MLETCFSSVVKYAENLPSLTILSLQVSSVKHIHFYYLAKMNSIPIKQHTILPSPQMIVPNATDSSEDALDCVLNLFSSPDKAVNQRDPSFIRCYNSKNAKG